MTARARSGGDELRRCAPRLPTLLIDGMLTEDDGIEAIELLTTGIWADDEWVVITEVLDTWWYQTLLTDAGGRPGGHGPDTVLGWLSATGPRMSRWLHVWLTELDGSAAVHLAEAVVARFPSPAWKGRSDERNQVMGWARSEPVVNGLTLIGGSHLDHELLDRALDALIVD